MNPLFGAKPFKQELADKTYRHSIQQLAQETDALQEEIAKTQTLLETRALNQTIYDQFALELDQAKNQRDKLFQVLKTEKLLIGNPNRCWVLPFGWLRKSHNWGPNAVDSWKKACTRTENKQRKLDIMDEFGLDITPADLVQETTKQDALSIKASTGKQLRCISKRIDALFVYQAYEEIAKPLKAKLKEQEDHLEIKTQELAALQKHLKV